MAKINIEFDGKIYSVNEDTLAPLASPLERALIQQLAGTGAVIRLGGTNYNVDANKLASARNVLTNHLGNVAGTDGKVTVAGTEYGLSKTKLQSATDKMHVTLSGMVTTTIDPGLYEMGSNCTVMLKSWDELLEECITVDNGILMNKVTPPADLPAKNEYGFYYDVKYYLGNTQGYWSLAENGRCTVWDMGRYQYEYKDGWTAEYAQGTIMAKRYECDPNDPAECYVVDECVFEIRDNGLRLFQGPETYREYICGETSSLTDFEDGSPYEADYIGELVLPTDGSVTCIGNAFRGACDYEFTFGARGIAIVLIPESVSKIETNAFGDTYGLLDIYINKPEDSIPDAPWGAPDARVHWNSTRPEE